MIALDLAARAREDARADRATRRHLARLRDLSPAEIHRALHCDLPPFVDSHTERCAKWLRDHGGEG